MTRATDGSGVGHTETTGAVPAPVPDELRVALDGLRREIRARFPARAPAPVRATEWEVIFSELRRRVSTLGMVERSGDVDEFGMDEIVLRRTAPLLDFLFDSYFRVDVEGAGDLPEHGPCLLVANHSGLLPYDGLMVCHALERSRAGSPRARFLVADWMNSLPFVQPYLARLGGVRACRENALRLLRSEKFVVAFPEGQKGAAKVFRERYRLQRFGRGGAIRLALEVGAPLVPVGIVGAEEAHPILFKWGLPGRLMGLPFVPVTPTFPWLGPLGLAPLPAKWVIRFGAPLPIDHLGPDAAADELLISRLNEDLRTRVQDLVDAGLSARETVWS